MSYDVLTINVPFGEQLASSFAVRIRVKNSKDNRDNVRFPLVLVLNFEVLMPNQLSTRSGCGARASKFYTALILGALDGRSKDELDLLRIADAYPEYLRLLPEALRARL